MNNGLFIIIAGYLLVINIILFLMMRSDKLRAKRRGGSRHRIPERRLLGLSALGGALGAWLALRLLHHKTKHAAFAIGLPVMLLLHIGVLYVLYRYLQ